MYAELKPYYDWLYEWVVTPASTWSGLVTVVLVLWTWYTITFGRAWRYRRWFREASATANERPGIFIVDLSPKTNIAAKIERYRQDNLAIKDVPADRIFSIQRKQDLTVDDMRGLTDELRAKMREMGHCGVGAVHLFYAGPVAFAPIIGGEMINSFKVLLYQHNTTSDTYDLWGPLRHPVF